MITVEEAAAELNGNECREEGSNELFARMKEAGLVAVFGASDDLIEFRGAIDDEYGAYEGGEYVITRDGLPRNKCDDDDCPYFAASIKSATKIKAIWDDGDFSWQYETSIPHSKFVIDEDGEPYCEGIVFALADVPA
jgi:hypothetical protein